MIILFKSRNQDSTHISTWLYARLVDNWVQNIGFDPGECGTHSLRRTKASLIYRRTKNLRAVQLLLGPVEEEPAGPFDNGPIGVWAALVFVVLQHHRDEIEVTEYVAEPR